MAVESRGHVGTYPLGQGQREAGGTARLAQRLALLHCAPQRGVIKAGPQHRALPSPSPSHCDRTNWNTTDAHLESSLLLTFWPHLGKLGPWISPLPAIWRNSVPDMPASVRDPAVLFVYIFGDPSLKDSLLQCSQLGKCCHAKGHWGMSGDILIVTAGGGGAILGRG